VDGQQPGRGPVRQLYQRIVTRDVEGRPRRAVIGRGQIERQRRGDRVFAVPRAGQPKAARFGEREARGAVGLERWRRIHLKLLLDVGAASSVRVSGKRKKPRDRRRRRGGGAYTTNT